LSAEQCTALHRSPEFKTACEFVRSKYQNLMTPLERGCELGDWFGCWASNAAPSKFREAADEACTKDDARGCAALRTSWSDAAHRPLQSAYARVEDELEACLLDGGASCHASREAHDAVDDAKDAIAKAAAEKATEVANSLRTKCNAGDSDACIGLAGFYVWGELPGDAARPDLGIKPAAGPDPTGGAALLRRACDLGKWAGCIELAMLYRTGGAGVPRSDARARAFAQQARSLLWAECADGGTGAYGACLVGVGVMQNFGLEERE
jgi:hypothetical protein